ncbi:MAG: patatin-like phospholipase family protein, partial [Anaerolineales bacterium]
LNAIQLSANPTLRGAESMAQVWRRVGPEHVGCISFLGGLQRLVLQRESLFPSHPLARFLLESFPAGLRTFGELQELHGIPAYVLAASLDTETRRVFGDDPDDKLLDGAMASAALPPYFAPWRVNGHFYVDGGIFTNLPLRVALERGASELTVLWVKTSIKAHPPNTGMIRVTSAAFTMMVRNLSALELDWARSRGIPIRLIELTPPEDVSFWDFSQVDRLMAHGRRAAERLLSESKDAAEDRWWRRLLRGWRPDVS